MAHELRAIAAPEDGVRLLGLTLSGLVEPDAPPPAEQVLPLAGDSRRLILGANRCVWAPSRSAPRGFVFLTYKTVFSAVPGAYH